MMSGASKTQLIPSPRIDGCTAYCVPRGSAPVDLRLDGNEGPAPSATLFDVLTREGPELFRQYPTVAPLHETLAQRFGVDTDRVIVTAGGDDALWRACLAMLSPGREMILPTPSFEMLGRYAKLAGADVVSVPWNSGDYPLEAVLDCVGPKTALIVVVSPNNPTGAVARAGDLVRLAEVAPHALLVVDLAYGEFADEDLTRAALALNNALVVRTFSKAWGLAGLRVGYAIGPADVIGWLRVTGSPYAVSGPSAIAAAACLESRQAEMETYVQRVRRERGELIECLTRLGTEPLPSQANFVLARVADALWTRDGLAGLGIAIRAFPGREGMEDCVRITCPGEQRSFGRLTAALEAVLTPEVVLVDHETAPRDGMSARWHEVRIDSRRSVDQIAEELDATMKALGVKRGWLVSGLVDAMRAARRVGLVPVGWRHKSESDETALTEAGAARVLSSVSNLMELLP